MPKPPRRSPARTDRGPQAQRKHPALARAAATFAEPSAALDLTALGGQGDALGRLASGEVVLVEGGVPGDRVRVALTGTSRGVQRGRLLELLTPSPARVPAPCPVFGRCGGCQWQHIDLGLQRRELLILATRALGPGGAALVADDRVAAYGHRRRMRLHLRRSCGRLQAGFLQRGSDELAATSVCPVLVPELQALLERLPAVLEPVIDQGELHAVHGIGGTIAALFARPRAGGAGLLDTAALAQALGVVGLSARVGPLAGTFGLTEVELPETVAPLRPGWPSLPVRVDAAGFCQATAEGNTAIRAAVVQALDAIGAVPRCQEFYAGSGNLSVLLAGRTPRLRTLEFNEAASGRAVRSLAPLAALGTQPMVITGDAAAMAEPPLPGELWLLDPGRPGAKELCAQAAAWRPAHLIYVSCAMDTLGRDLRTLQAGGYRQVAATLVDTMPQTPHAELIVHLQMAR